MVLGRSGRGGRPVSRSFKKGGVREISRAACASEKNALRAGDEYWQERSRAGAFERAWLALGRSSSRGKNTGALSALRGIGQRRIHSDQRRGCSVANRLAERSRRDLPRDGAPGYYGRYRRVKIPAAEKRFRFVHDLESARDAVTEIISDWASLSRQSRSVAVELFDSERNLRKILGLPPPPA